MPKNAATEDEHHMRHHPRRVHFFARRFYLHRAGLELAV